MKFYKWAVNAQTIKDMGVYSYADDSGFNFQNSYSNDYYAHFIDNNLEIPDSINA